MKFIKPSKKSKNKFFKQFGLCLEKIGIWEKWRWNLYKKILISLRKKR